MARKSLNTKGNPYHDETTGQFTSSESSTTPSIAEDGKKHFAIRLKPNFDLNAAKNDLHQTSKTTQQTTTIGEYREATSVQEAVEIGRSILPGCLVNYSENCDVQKLNDLNMALSDISKRFPGFVQNGLLNTYGDGLSLNTEQLTKTIKESALNVIKNDKHFSELYDKFFNYSKEKYGLKDEEKYSEKIIGFFMRIDRNFDLIDYTRSRSGGGALAYYQVSQDNIFNPNAGGKGINGGIKFYNNILQKPSRHEIEENDYAVKTGFHFNYGEHSYTYGTGVHELGHSIFTIAFKKCTDEERDEAMEILKEGTGKSYGQVSGYGHTNFYEQEAEAVADVMCRGEKATPHNKKLVAWLDKVHARLKNSGLI